MNSINWSGFLSLNRLVWQFLGGVGFWRGVSVQDNWADNEGCPAYELKVENETEEENCNKNKIKLDFRKATMNSPAHFKKYYFVVHSALAIQGFAIHSFEYSHWILVEPNPGLIY